MKGEAAIQAFLFEVLRLKGVRGLIAYHPYNNPRSARQGVALRKMGLKKGVADIALVLPGGRAAYIEVKRAEGRQSMAQRAFQLLCECNGTPYRLVRSSDEGLRVLRELGAIKP